MQFLTYWELNEEMPIEQRQQIAEHLTSSGAFPPPNVDILRWDATPDGWGILLLEAESAADCFRAINTWRASGTGFFKITKTAPAMPVQEAMATATEMMEALGAV
ncbi:MAG: DUF3303 domain-containing protein [Rhodothermales bacterium]